MHAVFSPRPRQPLADNLMDTQVPYGVGGRSLLARHLDLLHRFGVRQADLVVGFEADRIIEHVATLASRPDVALHFNPRYEQGSVLSLWAAADTLRSGEPVLVMDADVLYHPGSCGSRAERARAVTCWTATSCTAMSRSKSPCVTA
jgi:choline kinase